MSGSRLDLPNAMLLKLVRQLRVIYCRRRIRAMARQSPEFFKPLDKDLEREHQAYWGLLGKVDCHWLRLFVNLSGIEDKRYVPNDIYLAIVERRLNDGNYTQLIADKNYLERLFGQENFPRVVLRCMSGVFLDRGYSLAPSPLKLLPARNLVVKPSVDSKGGTGIALLRYENGKHRVDDGVELSEQLLQLRWGPNFLVQELIQQHAFCAAFNSSSVNTFRVYVYRSVADEQIHVLKVVFRNGAAGSVVDNMSSPGGVSTVLDEQGRLNTYAVSRPIEIHRVHPVSGEAYDGRTVPHFDQITRLPCEIAASIPSHRLLGFDVALCEDGSPVVVEINPMGIGLDLMQYGRGPLFGAFTDEVIQYCAANPDKDNMRILRT